MSYSNFRKLKTKKKIFIEGWSGEDRGVTTYLQRNRKKYTILLVWNHASMKRMKNEILKVLKEKVTHLEFYMLQKRKRTEDFIRQTKCAFLYDLPCKKYLLKLFFLKEKRKVFQTEGKWCRSEIWSTQRKEEHQKRNKWSWNFFLILNWSKR